MTRLRDNETLVSVILPVFNGEKYVEQAVKSLIGQTYKNLEIIIVEDGSTDNSLRAVQDLAILDDRIKVLINLENLGVAESLNRAISVARGEYVARMDADDVRLPRSIAMQVEYMQTHPETVVVGGAVEVCDGQLRGIDVRRFPTDDKTIRRRMFRYNPFAHPTVMIRRSALDKERYRTDLVEDYDLWFRLGRLGQLANLDDVLLKLRIHPQSISQQNLRRQEKLSLLVRRRAVSEYGYQMGIGDSAFYAAQWLSGYIFPVRWRYWMYSLVRRYIH